jgi:alanine-synthesizing transaminase
LKFSTRSSPPLATNPLARALAALRARGGECLDLTESNPTSAGIAYQRDLILEALASEGALIYEPKAFGLDSAREAVAHELSPFGVDASRVVLTASTSEAYAFLFKLLCDAGDDVLVPQPSYPLFELLARFEAVRLTPYRLSYDGEWHIDLDSLRRAKGPRSRAVLVVNPNNPTGSFLKKEELTAITSLELPIVSDEVFAAYGMAGDARRVSSALEAKDALVFALGGLSKLAGLPQMKLAWIVAAGPGADVDAALGRLELIADSFLSVGAPVQHALPKLLGTREPAEAAIRDRTRHNLATLQTRMGDPSPISVLRVEGGWYATLRLPRTRSEERWVLDFLEAGVYVHPGHFFDFAEEAYVIVSLLTRPEVFAEGIQRVHERVNRGA